MLKVKTINQQDFKIVDFVKSESHLRLSRNFKWMEFPIKGLQVLLRRFRLLFCKHNEVQIQDVQPHFISIKVKTSIVYMYLAIYNVF